jgi:hypothetical protein
MSKHSEGVRRIVDVLSVLSVIGWVWFVALKSHWFSNLRPIHWLIFAGGWVVAYFVPQWIRKTIYWVIDGFKVTERQIVATENEIKKIQERSFSSDMSSIAVCECGAGLTVGQKFCGTCGKDVQAILSQAIKPAEDLKPCSTCGTEIKGTAKFCGKCGAKQ